MNWPCDDIEPPTKDKRWKLNGAYTRPDPPKWMTIVAWVAILAIITGGLLIAESYAGEPSSRGQANGQGEPLGTHVEWALHPSLGVVFHYEIEGDQVYYAHAVMAHGPAPECKGLMGQHENCQGYSRRMGSIILMTIENETPYLYMVESLPNARRIESGEYEPMVSVTFRGCE